MGDDNLYQILPTNFRRLLKHSTSTIAVTCDEYYLPMFSGDNLIAIKNNMLSDEWGRGFCFSVHGRIINSGTGPRIIKAIENKVVSTKVRIECSDDTNAEEPVKFEWLNEDDLTSEISTITSMMLSRGQCLLRVKKEYNAILNAEVYALKTFPLLRYSYKLNSNNQIVECSIYIRTAEFDKANSFILTEHRFFDSSNQPKRVYMINQIKVVDSGTGAKPQVISYRTPKELETIKTKLERCFPEEIKSLGKVEDLPFKGTLGLYLINNTDYNLKVTYSNIGESQFTDAMDWMMSEDTAHTYKNLDMYLGKGTALIPRSFNAQYNSPLPMMAGENRIGRIAPSYNTYTPLDNTMFTEYENKGALDKPSVPTVFQHELRTEQWWKEIKENLAQIASACGVSITDIDPSQANGDYRNEADIDSQRDLSMGTAKKKRALIGKQINKMLNDIALSEGSDKTFSLRWSQEIFANKKANIEMANSKYASGTQSLEETVKELHPDWSYQDVLNELEKIKKEQDSKTESDLLNDL